MTLQEFKSQLTELHNAIISGILFYTIWIALWPTDESVNILNRWRGLFIPVRSALYEMMVIHLSKVFDRDHRAISVRYILQAAKGDPSLVPHATQGQLDEIKNRVSCLENSPAWESIKRDRDQRLAHLDASPLVKKPLIKKDFDSFIEGIEWVFEQLWSMHNRSARSSSYQVERSAWEAGEILRISQEDADRTARKTDEILRAIQEEGT